ncbi:hypothetical protein [Chitinivorax sp. B]|uniref:hypothetical protein n=1 Tax=Chitinivorax sp. B TaxID=2502235 RepID=UPI00148580D6|nr:hypothetical protein [Chitinivorax sp. B]
MKPLTQGSQANSGWPPPWRETADVTIDSQKKCRACESAGQIGHHVCCTQQDNGKAD